MKSAITATIFAIIFAIIFAVQASTAAASGQIERACLKAGRDRANAALCGCVQDAANLTLSASDQRLASGFFRAPEKADEMRGSTRAAHEQFWQRYLDFSNIANQYCG